MTNAVRDRHEIDVDDIEYLRHGDDALLARIYRPRGQGPFPLVVDLHGGAWCRKDRTTDVATCEALARSGVVAVALDFRMPPVAAYPASLADINYAIRWIKSRAAEFATTPERVGILGVSSGGHQAMLTAMRPHDPRYAALPLPGFATDASVAFVVLCWPVIDPLGRYRYARKRREDGDPKVAEQVMPSHDQYWGTEDAMAEGSPTMALERGEVPPHTPPVLYVQGTADVAHPRPDLDRFVAAYRGIGGRVDLHFVEGMGEAFITNDPQAPASVAANEKIVDFVLGQFR